MEEDRHRYEEAGMNAFLAKPYTSTELSAVLEEASYAQTIAPISW